MNNFVQVLKLSLVFHILLELPKIKKFAWKCRSAKPWFGTSMATVWEVALGQPGVASCDSPWCQGFSGSPREEQTLVWAEEETQKSLFSVGKMDFVWRGNRACPAFLRLGTPFTFLPCGLWAFCSLPCTLWGMCFSLFSNSFSFLTQTDQPRPCCSKCRLKELFRTLSGCSCLIFPNKSQAGNVSSNRGKVELFIAQHISISEELEDETIPGFLSFSALFKEPGRLWFPELLDLRQRNLVYSVFQGFFSSLTIIIVFF